MLPDGKLLYFGNGYTLHTIDPNTGNITEYYNIKEKLDPNIGNLNMENISDQTD